MRLSSATGSLRMSKALATVNTAVASPTPRPMIAMAAAVKPRDRARRLTAICVSATVSRAHEYMSDLRLLIPWKLPDRRRVGYAVFAQPSRLFTLHECTLIT